MLKKINLCVCVCMCVFESNRELQKQQGPEEVEIPEIREMQRGKPHAQLPLCPSRHMLLLKRWIEAEQSIWGVIQLQGPPKSNVPNKHPRLSNATPKGLHPRKRGELEID